MSLVTGRCAVKSDDNGSSSCCSCIFTTIFLNADGVRCFSWPLLRLRAESCSSGDDSNSGVVDDESSLWESSDSTLAIESTLADNSGTSFKLGRVGALMLGVVEDCGCGGQQKVSLFHNRQLRFSYLLPPSIESAHFEKTDTSIRLAFPPDCAARSTYQSTFHTGSPHSEDRSYASWRHPPTAQARSNAATSWKRPLLAQRICSSWASQVRVRTFECEFEVK